MLVNQSFEEISKDTIKDKRIIIYGASTRNKAMIERLNLQKNILYFVDGNDANVGKTLDGYEIKSIENIEKSSIVISVLDYAYPKILARLKEQGINKCIFYYPEYFDMAHIYSSNCKILENAKEYKYIHIFSNDKFMRPFYQMIEERFNIDEHLFIMVYRFKDDFSKLLPYALKKNRIHNNILIFDGVHGVAKNAKRLVPENKDCNSFFYADKTREMYNNTGKIILHSALFGTEDLKYVKWLVDNYAGKMHLIFWGADTGFEKEKEVVQDVIKKVGAGYAACSRVESIKRQYGMEVTGIQTSYCYLTDNNKPTQKKDGDCINILLGHSAAEYVNHKQGFDLLHNYRNKNIKIYCPLSYGSTEYRDKVIEMGNGMFGDKFVPMTDFMELDEYYNFLNKIDVAILPMLRMAAGTTIFYLSAAGATIYMNQQMIDSFGYAKVEATDIAELENMDFNKFIDALKNEHIDTDKITELNDSLVTNWRKLLEDTL